MNPLVTFVKKVPLIEQIAIGLVIGIMLAVFVPSAVPFVSIFGDLFVSALKGVAPVLVFILVMNAMTQRKSDGDTNMKPIVTLYVLGTFAASLVGVTLSFLFPVTLQLSIENSEINPPSGIAQVLHTLIMNVVDNPVNALLRANYIGILAWAVIIGLAMHSVAKEETKKVFDDLSKGITIVVSWVIRFAPLGIMGLVTQSISASGLSALLSYLKLLGVLIASYALVALVMNPIIVFAKIHRNPYPLVFATIRESGIYAFFTRSSAANIPVNLSLCKRLGLNPDTYTISISWRYNQYGRCFDYNFCPCLGSGQHLRNPSRSFDSPPLMPHFHRRCLWGFRCSWRFSASDSCRLCFLWHLQRPCHAGCWRWIHHLRFGRCL